MKKRIVLIVIAAVVLIAAVVAVVITQRPSAKEGETIQLRQAVMNSIVAHLDSIVADEAGYYGEEGLDVTINYNNSNPDNIQALLDDKVDFVSAGSTAVLNYIDQGADLVIIGGQMSQGASLFTLPERAEEFQEITAETLEGKKVGVTRLQTGDIALRKYLSDLGADLSKIEFVELDSCSTIIEAIKKGEVDIGSLYLTFRETGEQQGLVAVKHLDELWDGFICCRLFTTREKLEANRDAFVKVLKANIKAYNLIQTDRDKTLELAKKDIDLDESILASQIYDYGHLELSPDPAAKDTTDFYNAMVDIGYAEGNVDISQYIDSSLYEEALNELLEEEPDNEVYQALKASFVEKN